MESELKELIKEINNSNLNETEKNNLKRKTIQEFYQKKTQYVKIEKNICTHYPKKKCSQWCKDQDAATAVYTPPTTYVKMNQYYGPWGRSGTYPSFHQQVFHDPTSHRYSRLLCRLSLVCYCQGRHQSVLPV